MKKDGLTQSMNTFKRSPWEQSHVASSCNFSFIFPFPRLCRSSAEKNSKSPKCKVASVIWTWKSRDFVWCRLKKFEWKISMLSYYFERNSFSWNMGMSEAIWLRQQSDEIGSGARELKEEGDISLDSVRVLPIGAEVLDSQNDPINRDKMWIFMSKYRETQLILSILC